MSPSDVAGFITAVAAIIAAVGTVWNGRRLKIVHEATNGMVAEMVRVARVAAVIEGVEIGRKAVLGELKRDGHV